MPTRNSALAAVLLSSLSACRAHEVIVGTNWDSGVEPDTASAEALPPLVFAPATLTLLAGSLSGRGSADGTAAAARFFSPAGVAVDGAGNVFIADMSNHTIRKLTPDNVVTTVAGVAGSAGSDDGSPGRFRTPFGVAVDSAGNVFVADTGNSTLRKITPERVVSTLAGSAGVQGAADGTGAAASFAMPLGLALDSAGNIFVADSGNNTIRQVTPGYVVTTVAGAAGRKGNANGTRNAARFNYPTSVAVHPSGNLIVGDTENNAIRQITPAGVVSTLVSTAADFHGPAGVAVDADGNLYVADYGNDTIRKITPTGAIITLAGSAGNEGAADGSGDEARFNSPSGVAVGADGNLYVADFGNNTLRKVTPAGDVSTLAGTVGTSVSVDGTGAAARFAQPWGVTLDPAGNVIVADTASNTIRRISRAGAVTTMAGATGVAGSANGVGNAARFNRPVGVAADGEGNVFVADTDNHTLRWITPAGVVHTLAGSAGAYGDADGTGTAARFRNPTGVALDRAGNVLIADQNNHTIRSVTRDGVVVTVAGTAGVSGANDGIGTAATFAHPSAVAVDGAGNILVADTDNGAIRAIGPDRVTTTLDAADTTGSPDGGSAGPRFNRPCGLGVGGDGGLLVVDRDNNAIRKLMPGGGRSTVVGVAAVTTAGNVPGLLPGSLDRPRGVAVDPTTGSLYITVDWAVLVATP